MSTPSTGTQTARTPQQEALARKALSQEIARIKAAPADSRFAQANQHVINAVGDAPEWWGAGLLELAGFYWYTMECDLAIVGANVAAVDFSASGTAAAFAAIECELGGFFVVDPTSVAGDCSFTLAVGAVGEGAVSLSLYGSNGTFYGTFAGDAEGAGGAGINGTGTLATT
jgi:hypothetical protein